METVTDFGLCAVGDKKAHAWSVDCYYGAEKADLTGYIARGYFVRSDRSTVMVDGTIEGNTVTCVLSEHCYRTEGQLKGALKISNTTTGETVTIGAMSIRLTASMTDTVVDPEGTIPSLSDLLNEIEAMHTATAAAQDATREAVAAAKTAKQSAEDASSAATQANTAASNAASAAKAANEAADKATKAAEDTAASLGGLSFSVNPEDGGLDITYTY